MENIEQILLFPPGRGKEDFLRPDGIWDFLPETVDSSPETTRMARETVLYQGKYQTLEAATAYNVGYRERKHRRTRKETEILRTLLRGFGGTILDMPCGGGRLSPVIAEFASAIVEMDLSLGQLLYGKESSRVPVDRTWIRASGFTIPLKDDSVDGSVCIRLSHHLHAPEEKERLLSELLRVARRFVLFSFVDSSSLKYTLRIWRSRVFGAPLRKNSMGIREIRNTSAKFGGDLRACLPIGPFQSHRYALIVKKAE